MRATLLSPLVVGLAVAVAACGSDDAPSDGNTGDPIVGDLCDSDENAEPFVAGMSKTTEGGLTVTALSAEPAPPAQGRNRWMFEVKDESGTPLPEAIVQVTCTMFHPGGSHGCPATPGVTDQGNGQYEAYPITFNMGGHWDLSVGVTLGTVVEKATFSLCID